MNVSSVLNIIYASNTSCVSHMTYILHIQIQKIKNGDVLCKIRYHFHIVSLDVADNGQVFGTLLMLLNLNY